MLCAIFGRAVVDRDAGVGVTEQHAAARHEILRIAYRRLERACDQPKRGVGIEVLPGVAPDMGARF
jgi:hypothetical protein